MHTPLPIVGLLEVFIRRPRVAHHHAQSACKRHLFAHGLPRSDGRADSEAAVERPSQVIVVLARQDVHVYVSTTTVQLKDLLDVVALIWLVASQVDAVAGSSGKNMFGLSPLLH